MPFSPTSPSRRSTLWLAQAGRDARWARHGGNDARTADHGPAIRGLHGCVPRIRARLPPMLAGTLGGLLATWVTFIPCFLWIFLGAPFVEALRDNKALNGALVGDHGGGGRRDPQSRDLVCAAYICFARSGRCAGTLGVRHAGAGERRPLGAGASLAAAIVAIFRFQGGDDHDPRCLLRRRRCSLPARCNRMSSTVKMGEGRTKGHALN